MIHTSRPLYWLVHFLFFVFGIMASGNFEGFTDIRFWVPTILLTLPYSYFIYAVNDYYDDESDHANKRKGGVFGMVHTSHEKLKLKRRSLLFFLLCAGTFSFFGVQVLIVYLILSADLFWYSAPPIRFKRIPFLDFITGGSLYGGLMYLLGYTIYQGDLGALLTHTPLNLLFILVITAFYHLCLAMFDIKADKVQHITTTAVTLGARNTLLFTLLLLIASMYFFTSKLNFFIDIVCRSIICLLLLNPRIQNSWFMQKFIGEYSLYYSFIITLLVLLTNPIAIN